MRRFVVLWLFGLMIFMEAAILALGVVEDEKDNHDSNVRRLNDNDDLEDMNGFCTIELYGVSQAMNNDQQVQFCDNWITSFNQAMQRDPCDQRLDFCTVQSQQTSRRNLRDLNKKKKKRKKNRVEVFNQGTCKLDCPPEHLFMAALNRRHLESAVTLATTSLESRSLVLTEEVLETGLIVECNRLLKSYSSGSDPVFKELEGISIECGNSEVVCGNTEER